MYVCIYIYIYTYNNNINKYELRIHESWPCGANHRAPLREMGGAPRNPAPTNHFLVWIVKPSGWRCADALGGKAYRRVPTPPRSTFPFSGPHLAERRAQSTNDNNSNNINSSNNNNHNSSYNSL